MTSFHVDRYIVFLNMVTLTENIPKSKSIQELYNLIYQVLKANHYSLDSTL